MKKRVREHILSKEGVKRCVIKRDGAVHAYGDMPRGDGGKRPWWRFEGYIGDIDRLFGAFEA